MNDLINSYVVTRKVLELTLNYVVIRKVLELTNLE